jgi:hypothetical protein
VRAFHAAATVDWISMRELTLNTPMGTSGRLVYSAETPTIEMENNTRADRKNAMMMSLKERRKGMEEGQQRNAMGYMCDLAEPWKLSCHVMGIAVFALRGYEDMLGTTCSVLVPGSLTCL